MQRLIAALIIAPFLASPLPAQPLHEETPIRYWDRSPRDFSADWERAAQDDELNLDTSDEASFLRSVLDELEVPVSSQVLVFSTTSFQVDIINPHNPRALYFNENHYVGWVPGGDLEITTADARTGLNFYHLPIPTIASKTTFLRDSACLSCHGPSADYNFPRLMLFSVFADEAGAQILRGKTHRVDHRTPIADRWGGWYVTGITSGVRHRGNLIAVAKPGLGDAIDLEAGDLDLGGARADLAGVVDLSPYPVQTSDILALLILEHQVIAHNQLMQAMGKSRIALWQDDAFFTSDPLGKETLKTLEAEAEALLEVFLFKDEADLSVIDIDPNQTYREAFLSRARRDAQGRSLRDLDLGKRIFKYRFSYMVHSDAFTFLPDEFKAVFFAKLHEVLAGKVEAYDYLSPDERQAIQHILTETLPAFTSTDNDRDIH